jgi:hypothetical protein
MAANWDDVLDAWEQQIVAAEQALATNDWGAVAQDEFVLPENLKEPTDEVRTRYEALAQRTASIEQRIVESGRSVLSQLEETVVSRSARNRFEETRDPSFFNERV